MYYIVCRVEIEGYHYWLNAPDYCEYLKNEHRHKFCITAKFDVSHSDREVEINDQSEKIRKYLIENYFYPCQFEGRSCEMIAEEICKKFGAFDVEVLEDGVNGGGYREK